MGGSGHFWEGVVEVVGDVRGGIQTPNPNFKN